VNRILEILIHGVGHPEVARLLIRVALGVFFISSGYHKLFNAKRHAQIVLTMAQDHVPMLWFNSWFVPCVEFSGGIAILVGFLAPLAAFGLFCVCAVATLTDGLRRIQGWAPIDRADWWDDLLYLPEVLYSIMLIEVMLLGAGPYSIDSVIARSVLA
jgi:putative oxidoreductase